MYKYMMAQRRGQKYVELTFIVVNKPEMDIKM